MAKNTVANLVRLNKYIADSGHCSRRKADTLIAEGEVKINGKKVRELGQKVDIDNDSVMVGNKRLQSAKKKQYLMFNKPKNVLTSTSDPTDRPLVSEYFDHFEQRLFPVGRLDWSTEGLLLMTNDGDFSQEISHPKKEVPKTYLAKLDRPVSNDDIDKLLRGVTIVGGKVRAQSIHKVRPTDSSKNWVKIVITQGKNRQIHKMFQKLSYDVVKLKRTAIGRLTIGSLKVGQFKHLTPLDIHKIFTATEETLSKKPKLAAKSSKKTTKKRRI